MKRFLIHILSIVFILSSTKAMELSGTVISDNEKIITSRYMGFIESVKVKEGDFVKKGQVLYKIDSSNIDNKKKEILYNLQIQKNNFQNVKTNYERYKRLYAKDLIPKYDLELLELKVKNIKNMIAISKAKLKEVNNQYNYLKILAPNDGLVIKKSIKSGEMAMPTSPAIILSDLSSLKIITNINESNLNKIKIGQKAKIYIDSLNFETKGEVNSIIPNINEQTHSFIIKLSFDSKNQKIYPGMYSKILFKLDTHE